MQDLQLIPEEVEKVRKAYVRAEALQAEDFERLKKYYSAYRSKVDEEDTRVVTRSKYVVPVAFKTVETILPRIISVIFSASPPVQSRWRIKPENPFAELQLRALDQVFEYLYDTQGFYGIVQAWFKQVLMYGQGYVKPGWRRKTQTTLETAVEQDENGNPKITRKEVQTPVEDIVDVSLVDVFSLYFAEDAVFPDPIGTAKYIIHKVPKRQSEILRLKDAGVYGPKGGGNEFTEDDLSPRMPDDQTPGRPQAEIPDKDDPIITVYEYWEDDWVIATADHRVLLRNEANPFGLQGQPKRKPFIAAYDTLVPQELFQIGEIEPVFHNQVERSVLRRQRTDNNSLIINTGMFYDKDAEIDLESWGLSRPGMAVGVRTFGQKPISEVVMPISRGDINGASYREDQELDKDAQETSGLLDYAVGSAPERRETATTVQLLQAAANARFDIKVRNFVDAFLQLNRAIHVRLKQFLTQPIPLRIPMPSTIMGPMGPMPMGEKYLPVTKDMLPHPDEVDLTAPGNPGLLLKDARQQKLLQFYSALSSNPAADPMAALQILTVALKEADIDGIDRIVAMLEQPSPMMMPPEQGQEGPQAPSAPQPPPTPNVNPGVNENPTIAIGPRPER